RSLQVSRRSILAGLAGFWSGVGIIRRASAKASAPAIRNPDPKTCSRRRVVLDGSAAAQDWLSKNVGPKLDAMQPRPSREIPASPLSVGMETLDRRMFEPERTYEALAELGVKWARLQTGWARTETRPGVYDFAWLDAVVDAVSARGVQPWFNLGYGNRLYTPEAPDDSAVGWIPIFRAEAMAAWLRYVEVCARHFRDRIRHWELWNEPNIAGFWKPNPPSAEAYVRFVSQTAAVLRREIPDAVLIGGALAGMPTDYLTSALQHGLLDHVDKVSYHPYRPIPEKGYAQTLETWRRLLRQYAGNRPMPRLWQGENGCPSKRGSAGALADYDWNEVRQAKWLLRRILYDLVLGVELTSYFHLVDLLRYNWGSGPTDHGNFKGLLRGEDYSPKPAYSAYQRLCGLFDAETVRNAEMDEAARIDAPPAISQVAADAISPHAGSSGIPSPPDVPEVDGDVIGPAGFIRRGTPLWVYWKASRIGIDAVPQIVDLRIQDEPNAPMRRPVLLDPLSGGVHQLLHARRESGGWRLVGIPLADYPLIVADSALL
ncbi:MAG: hypothetical protein GYA33_15535, partial [Thermogutta sp.]|nr:hypothetical protein [Thermogutta sp.]